MFFLQEGFTYQNFLMDALANIRLHPVVLAAYNGR
jgi:hypothetical protein